MVDGRTGEPFVITATSTAVIAPGSRGRVRHPLWLYPPGMCQAEAPGRHVPRRAVTRMAPSRGDAAEQLIGRCGRIVLIDAALDLTEFQISDSACTPFGPKASPLRQDL